MWLNRPTPPLIGRLCTCGAHAIGIKNFGVGHSLWCGAHAQYDRRNGPPSQWTKDNAQIGRGCICFTRPLEMWAPGHNVGCPRADRRKR